MVTPVRTLAALATLAVAATPALAQPTPGAEPFAVSPAPPPITAGTVVIVTPGGQVVTANSAAPGQAMAASAPGIAPALQTQPWSNVSHINGQLVKVGEQRDYLYDTGRHTIIATNPLGWLFGFYGVSVSHELSSNFAIRADANLFSIGNHGTGFEVGLSVPLYLQRTFSGPFLEPGVVVRNFEDRGENSVGPEVMVGWQWSFDSGFSMAMAFGGLKNLNRQGSNDTEPAGYFRVGYAM